MRYGVLSDIHSNLEALRVVLDFLKAEKVEGYLCCGDFVGYGPDPEACLEAVGTLPHLTAVIGNHDQAVLGKMDLAWFNDAARAAVLWTKERMGGKGLSFLASIPERQEKDGSTIVHGSPSDPLREYLLSPEQFLGSLSHFKVSPCFIGHSHLPLYFALTPDRKATGDRLRHEQVLSLAGQGPWIINPGSVGQPRDGDPRASFGIFDPSKQTFQLFRIAYEVKKVQRKMLKAGLPQSLADRLEYGQ